LKLGGPMRRACVRAIASKTTLVNGPTDLEQPLQI
jgi:hypothetical protein